MDDYSFCRNGCFCVTSHQSIIRAMARIYVASSWRNPYYESVVKRLRQEGFPVYDFRNPPHGGAGFHWTDVDENAPNWTFEQYAEGLHHPLAERQFEADLEALKSADTCVLVLPCGRSAHTEAGWMAGAGPELMYKLFDRVVGNLEDLVQCLCYDGEIREPDPQPLKNCGTERARLGPKTCITSTVRY